MSADGFEDGAGRGIPKPDGFVDAARGQDFAGGAEGDRVDAAGVALEFLEWLAVLDSPQADCFILAARSQQRAVAAEGDAINLIAVAREGFEFLARGGVPELDGFVKTGGGQRLAVRADRDVVNEPGVPFEFARQLSAGQGDGEKQQRSGDECAVEHG